MKPEKEDIVVTVRNINGIAFSGSQIIFPSKIALLEMISDLVDTLKAYKDRREPKTVSPGIGFERPALKQGEKAK